MIPALVYASALTDICTKDAQCVASGLYASPECCVHRLYVSTGLSWCKVKSIRSDDNWKEFAGNSH